VAVVAASTVVVGAKVHSLTAEAAAVVDKFLAFYGGHCVVLRELWQSAMR